MLNQTKPINRPKPAVWKHDDDELLRKQIQIFGLANWKVVARAFNGTKSLRQCRHRWNNKLCNLKYGEPWTPNEDSILIESHKQFGNKWTKIGQIVKGRSEYQIKNRLLNLFGSCKTPTKSLNSNGKFGGKSANSAAVPLSVASLPLDRNLIKPDLCITSNSYEFPSFSPHLLSGDYPTYIPSFDYYCNTFHSAQLQMIYNSSVDTIIQPVYHRYSSNSIPLITECNNRNSAHTIIPPFNHYNNLCVGSTITHSSNYHIDSKSESPIT